jgi:hypothetical protein
VLEVNAGLRRHIHKPKPRPALECGGPAPLFTSDPNSKRIRRTRTDSGYRACTSHKSEQSGTGRPV